MLIKRGSFLIIVVVELLLIAVLLYGAAAGVQGLSDKEEADVLSSLEVMTCNIGDLNGHQRLTRGKVVDFLKLCGIPDVLFLQEVGDENEAKYFSNELGLNYFVFLNDFQSTCGIAILSKTPLSNSDRIYFKSSEKGYGAVAADVMVGANLKVTRNLKVRPNLKVTRNLKVRPNLKVTRKKVQVVNVHLDSIDKITMKDKKIEVNLGSILWFVKNEIWGDSVRSQSAKELMQWLGEKKADHVVLGGDFNSVPFSKTIRIIGSRFDDALWPSLTYLSGTYKRLNFPVAPRIDFLFLSSNLQCRQASVLPLSPGDHFPVRAHVEI